MSLKLMNYWIMLMVCSGCQSVRTWGTHDFSLPTHVLRSSAGYASSLDEGYQIKDTRQNKRNPVQTDDSSSHDVWVDVPESRIKTVSIPPGESITSISCSAPLDWSYTTIHSGPYRQAHILIKSLKKNAQSDLIVTTNQRILMFHLRCVDDPGSRQNPSKMMRLKIQPALHPSVELHDSEMDTLPKHNPEEKESAWACQYQCMHGRCPSWIPHSVYIHHFRTHILFRNQIFSDSIPSVFERDDSQWLPVNYHMVSADHLMIDHAIEKGTLILGRKRVDFLCQKR